MSNLTSSAETRNSFKREHRTDSTARPATGATAHKARHGAVVTFPRAHRQELPYRCSACGAERGCDCNAPAIEKAATALARSPEKSDRAIAKEEGINRRTVAKARNQLAHGAPVDARVGLDGKARRMPRHTENDEAEDEPEQDREDDMVAAPETVKGDILETLDHHRYIAKVYRRIISLLPGFKDFDEAARSEIRTATEGLIRKCLFLSTLGAADRSGAAAKDTQHRQFSGVYAVQASELSCSSNYFGKPTFLEPAPHHEELPIVGYFLRRGPKDYVVLSMNPKRYRTMHDALAAVERAAAEKPPCAARADPAGDMPGGTAGNDVDPEASAERRKQEFAEFDGAPAREEAVAGAGAGAPDIPDLFLRKQQP